jgi:hypothetical protein
MDTIIGQNICKERYGTFSKIYCVLGHNGMKLEINNRKKLVKLTSKACEIKTTYA